MLKKTTKNNVIIKRGNPFFTIAAVILKKQCRVMVLLVLRQPVTCLAPNRTLICIQCTFVLKSLTKI